MLCLSVAWCVLLRSPNLERWLIYMYCSDTSYATIAIKESACRIISTLCEQSAPNQRQTDVILWRHKQRISSYIDHHMPLHCSILEFVRGHTIKQSSRESPDLFTPLTVSHCEKNALEKIWSGLATLGTGKPNFITFGHPWKNSFRSSDARAHKNAKLHQFCEKLC